LSVPPKEDDAANSTELHKNSKTSDASFIRRSKKLKVIVTEGT
jgi:hypothetical protein